MYSLYRWNSEILAQEKVSILGAVDSMNVKVRISEANHKSFTIANCISYDSSANLLWTFRPQVNSEIYGFCSPHISIPLGVLLTFTAVSATPIYNT